MLLDDRFLEFLETLRGQSVCNRRNYTHRLHDFLAEHGRQPAAAVTPANVNHWHRELQQRRLAPATLAGYRQALKGFLNYCVEVGDINRSPAAHVSTGSFVSSRADKIPNEDAVARVSAVANAWLDSGHPQRTRDGLIWLLSCHSGPRLGEIRNLRLADVETSLRIGPDEYGVYRVPSTGKTGRVTIRYAGRVVDGFRAWLPLRPPTPEPVCFVTTRLPVRGLTRSAASHIYDSICTAAGVEPAILSHALRHRLGDLTTRQFGPKVAAILLNHRDWQRAATAIAFYHHPQEADASQAVLFGGGTAAPSERDELHRLFGIPDR